ncbi:hypothetical protein M426DRAFT_12566 [Hypoxylon sp. CI-4A]|nr:hypothetical protein M426DRAFT_12566 [Hypoxylon sp. CI-4A]
MAPDTNPPPPPPPPAAITTTKATKNPPEQHCADHRRNDHPRLRWAFLVGLVVLVLAVLVVGVVFTVYYDAMYYSSGAFLLKNNDDNKDKDKVDGNAMRNESVVAVVVGTRDLGVCGESRDSCQAYDKPNICCPEGIVCHASSFSPSGVFCCETGSPCLATKDKPPRCAGHSSACDKDLGGGCCAAGTECTEHGCLKVYLAAPGLESSIITDNQSPPPTSTRTTTLGRPSPTGMDGVTITTAKIGETVLSQGLKGVKSSFGFSSCFSLEVLALGVALAFSYAMVFRSG